MTFNPTVGAHPTTALLGALRRMITFTYASPHMTPSREDIDHLIMTNAFDESRLAEVLADYCQQYPELGEAAAQQLLTMRLSELVREGKIGLYEVEIGRSYESSKEYRDLSTEEALVVIQSGKHWGWAPNDDAKVAHCLFARDC